MTSDNSHDEVLSSENEEILVSDTINYRYCMAVVSSCCERNGTKLALNCYYRTAPWGPFTILRMTSGPYDPNVLGYIWDSSRQNEPSYIHRVSTNERNAFDCE